ncbi:hypothetical protein G9A89_010105 [Geosiphon pyriformis]|nr:hypothetical protein G9A89_010105 [Geosiphon pyriformis]
MKSQFLTILLIVAIGFVWAAPLPKDEDIITLDNPAAKSGTIKVTSPQPGPLARWSYQDVSWNPNVEFPNQWSRTVHIAIYQVVTGAPDKLIEQLGDKPYGNTWQGFQITDKYPLTGKFYALVVLDGDNTIYGTSDVFTIYEANRGW